MKYLVSASEMREYDSNTIEKTGIPACVLMERAALAAAEMIEERCAGRSGRRRRTGRGEAFERKGLSGGGLAGGR